MKEIIDNNETETPELIINSMLSGLTHEVLRIDSKVLEPSCGEGKILLEILKRKMKIIKYKYKRNQIEYEKYTLLAVSSLYGIETIKKNVNTCKKVLFEEIKVNYEIFYKNNAKYKFLELIDLILRKNIIHGDFLKLKNNKNILLEISEWNIINNNIYIREFSFRELFIENNKNKIIQPKRTSIINLN